MSKNVTELRFENGFILKSYDTFVAVKRNDGNHQVTGKWHSKTTSRQINEFFGGKREAFVNADREYKQLCEKVASIHKNIDATKSAGRSALQNIKRFLLLEELATKQSYKFEDVSGDTSAELEELTMNCNECWFYEFNSASDFALEQALEYSQVPAEMFKKIKKYEADLRIATQYKDDLRKRLMESFDLALKESNQNHKKEETK